MKILLTKPLFWIFIFVVLFILAMDFWSWGNAVQRYISGIPVWVIYFIGLQFLLSFMILLFNKFYWKE